MCQEVSIFKSVDKTLTESAISTKIGDSAGNRSVNSNGFNSHSKEDSDFKNHGSSNGTITNCHSSKTSKTSNGSKITEI